MARRQLAHTGQALTEAAERMRRAREHTREVVKEEHLPPHVVEAIETLQAACIELQQRVAFIEQHAITDVRVVTVDTEC